MSNERQGGKVRRQRTDVAACVNIHVAIGSYLLCLAVSSASFGQGTKEDYDRATALSRLTRGKVFRDRVDPHWFDDGRQMWYKVSTAPREWEFILVNVE